MIAKSLIEHIRHENNGVLSAEKLIDLVNYKAKTKGSFVTAKFGDGWKDFFGNSGRLSMQDLSDMAWFQGRRAILLEEFLIELSQEAESLNSKLTEYSSTILSLRGEVLFLTKMLDDVQCFFDKVGDSAKDELINEKTYDQVMDEKQIKNESQY